MNIYLFKRDFFANLLSAHYISQVFLFSFSFFQESIIQKYMTVMAMITMGNEIWKVIN